MSTYDDTLAKIKERNAYELAADAGCASPDTDTSPGAQLLTSVRDDVLEAVADGSLVPGEDDDAGRIHEIADGAPSVYTARKWAEFVDLAAYREDPSELLGGDASDMDKAASVCLYIIAERLANTLLTELAEARNEDDAEDDAEDESSDTFTTYILTGDDE